VKAQEKRWKGRRKKNLLLDRFFLFHSLRLHLAMPKKRRKISLFKAEQIHDLINCIYGNRGQQQIGLRGF
jgi:hypothetical protein